MRPPDRPAPRGEDAARAALRRGLALILSWPKLQRPAVPVRLDARLTTPGGTRPDETAEQTTRKTKHGQADS